MKKIISSVIASAMLFSTAAMAETVIAPTPQNVTSAQTQTFDGEVTNTEIWCSYGSGANKVKQEASNKTVEVVKNPFEGEDTTDDVLKFAHNTEGVGEASDFIMTPNAQLGDRDIFKISFDAALTNKGSSQSNLRLSIKMNGNETPVSAFKVFDTGWTNGLAFIDTVNDWAVSAPSASEFTHYEVIFDKGANQITYISGSKALSYPMKESININTVDSVTVRTEHSEGSSPAVFYVNNISYAVTKVTNEKVETFDTCQLEGKNTWNASQTLSNAKYHIYVANADSSQDIDASRGKVLKTWGAANSGSYVAMPLDYTMNNDDVFTFSFDYAVSENTDHSLYFYLDDLSADTARNMSIKLTSAKGELAEGMTTFDVTSSLFEIQQGKIWIGSKWQSEGARVFTPDKFSTVTVVIDNSDEDYGNKRTLAIYVDGNLYVTKWYMEDNEGAADLSTIIKGASLKFNAGGVTRYFDNLWASFTENEIKVDGDTASYTYPVVYDNAEEAHFIVAYYGEDGRFISAEQTSATPSDGRTVTANISEPTGTAKTRVFRWNRNKLMPLTPVWQSGSDTAQ
jgi:uncharacterized lipoprotein YehR (DUF1307 family)